MQGAVGDAQAVLVHLRPERVLDGVIYLGPARILAGIHHATLDLIESRDHIAAELISGGEPLLYYLDRRLATVSLVGAIEMPGAHPADVLVYVLDDRGGRGIVLAIFGIGILQYLAEVDAIAQTDVGKMAYIVVVATRLEDVAPLAEQLLDVGNRLLDGGCSLAAHAGVIDLRHLLLALGLALRLFSLYRALGKEHLQFGHSYLEGLSLPTKEGIGVVAEPSASGDVGALLVGSDAQQMGVVVHRLVYHQVEEFQDGGLQVGMSLVGADDTKTLSAHGDILCQGMRVLAHQL